MITAKCVYIEMQRKRLNKYKIFKCDVITKTSGNFGRLLLRTVNREIYIRFLKTCYAIFIDLTVDLIF